ncbi:MAG: hypothetical protein IJU92_02255 [Spirochaetaceae bacterium]|nr:hypothetical protein [Spirochaetaceae bacterium]
MIEKNITHKNEFSSEARLTFLESTSIIIGHGVGSGILAVPYLASRNSWFHILLVLALCYCINLLLHLMIAELSYNNNGAQFISCFKSELFKGKIGKAFVWLAFCFLAISVLINVSGFITGSAAVFHQWFGLPEQIGMLIYYVLASIVVFFGMKLVGIAEKFSVFSLILVTLILFIASLMAEHLGMVNTFITNTNILALYSTIAFSLSAIMSVPQVVKGSNGNITHIRGAIALGTGINAVLILLITYMTLLGAGNLVSERGAFVDLSVVLGGWISIVGFVFSLLALSTSFWANTLNLRDIVHEQTGLPLKWSYLVCSLPSFLLALFSLQSFVAFTRLAGIVQVLTGIGIIIAYHRSRKRTGTSVICGKWGLLPFEILIILSSILATLGSLIQIQ